MERPQEVAAAATAGQCGVTRFSPTSGHWPGGLFGKMQGLSGGREWDFSTE